MKKAEIVFSAFVLLLSVVTLIISRSYIYESDLGPGPGFFPVWISGILIVITALNLFVTLRKKFKTEENESFFSKDGVKRLIFCIVVLVIAILLIPLLGMPLSLAIFGTLVFKFVDKISWLRSALVSVGSVIVLFIIFDIWLNVPLPMGVFG